MEFMPIYWCSYKMSKCINILTLKMISTIPPTSPTVWNSLQKSEFFKWKVRDVWVKFCSGERPTYRSMLIDVLWNKDAKDNLEKALSSEMESEIEKSVNFEEIQLVVSSIHYILQDHDMSDESLISLKITAIPHDVVISVRDYVSSIIPECEVLPQWEDIENVVTLIDEQNLVSSKRLWTLSYQLDSWYDNMWAIFDYWFTQLFPNDLAFSNRMRKYIEEFLKKWQDVYDIDADTILEIWEIIMARTITLARVHSSHIDDVSQNLYDECEEQSMKMMEQIIMSSIFYLQSAATEGIENPDDILKDFILKSGEMFEEQRKDSVWNFFWSILSIEAHVKNKSPAIKCTLSMQDAYEVLFINTSIWKSPSLWERWLISKAMKHYESERTAMREVDDGENFFKAFEDLLSRRNDIIHDYKTHPLEYNSPLPSDSKKRSEIDTWLGQNFSYLADDQIQSCRQIWELILKESHNTNENGRFQDPHSSLWVGMSIFYELQSIDASITSALATYIQDSARRELTTNDIENVILLFIKEASSHSTKTKCLR